MRKTVAMLSFSLMLGACAGSLPPVTVLGEAGRLEGKWTGSYENMIAGRSGSIEFRLGPGVDTAQGSVLMIPEGWDRRTQGTRAPDYGPMNDQLELLQIRLVRVDGNRITGSLAEYREPGSGAMASTTFTGYLEGDVIEGKFITVLQGSPFAIQGHWRVTRQP